MATSLEDNEPVSETFVTSDSKPLSSSVDCSGGGDVGEKKVSGLDDGRLLSPVI